MVEEEALKNDPSHHVERVSREVCVVLFATKGYAILCPPFQTHKWAGFVLIAQHQPQWIQTLNQEKHHRHAQYDDGYLGPSEEVVPPVLTVLAYLLPERDEWEEDGATEQEVAAVEHRGHAHTLHIRATCYIDQITDILQHEGRPEEDPDKHCVCGHVPHKGGQKLAQYLLQVGEDLLRGKEAATDNVGKPHEGFS